MQGRDSSRPLLMPPKLGIRDVIMPAINTMAIPLLGTGRYNYGGFDESNLYQTHRLINAHGGH